MWHGLASLSLPENLTAFLSFFPFLFIEGKGEQKRLENCIANDVAECAV